MESDERTKRLIRELAGFGIVLPADLDERTGQLLRDLAAEKAAQLEGAKAVLAPLTFMVAVAVFAVCFWRYDVGLTSSIAAAIVTVPAMLLGVALPTGYVLGRRAAQRFKAHLRR
jgi:hypothetical protein